MPIKVFNISNIDYSESRTITAIDKRWARIWCNNHMDSTITWFIVEVPAEELKNEYRSITQ